MKAQPDKVKKEIDNLMDRLSNMEPDSEGYSQVLDRVERLEEIRMKKSPIKLDLLVPALTNIVGILLVLNYEKLDVVASKAFGLIKRP
jgi:hypothetical protein